MEKTTLKQEIGDEEESDMGLGVFDFPWLHNDEGMISKSDEEDNWNFQDTFWWCEVEYDRQCLYESHDNVWPLEAENGMEMDTDTVDCIWSWMLQHP
ncbi:hypothetical protein Ddye_012507 [Dipteronia dyeriana]|uniref:Uncharacterized protein n=1 Tax=Dipteronia dyeriana TaxID=168575 RepID=A0AAD9X4H4_9ROSI|nr:hypothetical protein Ddye_012507 [Dipteronia dyeriana]